MLKRGRLMLELNKIYNQDCLIGMKELDNASIDLIVTDPPYYIEALKEDLSELTIRESSKNCIFNQEWDSNFEDLDEYKHFIMQVLKQFKRILKNRGQVYMFFSYHHIDWVIKMIKDLGFRYYKPLIWYKPDTMGVFPNQYGCNYEVILWFRNNKKGRGVTLNIGCSQRDVWMINSTNINYRTECGFHPTCKPIKIIRQLIKNGSNENDLILDPFMGSGTTAKACKEINRNYMGFEKDINYIKIAEERLKQECLNFFKTNGEENNEELKTDDNQQDEGIINNG
jgi:DNA modification methylase